MFKQIFRKSFKNIRLFSNGKILKNISNNSPHSPPSNSSIPPNIPRQSNNSTHVRSLRSLYIIGGSFLAITSLIIEDLMNTPDGMISTILGKPGLTMKTYDETIGVFFNDVLLPSSDELLPEWPTAPCYAALGIPPGTPAPPLLVLDLEKTLIASEHDPRFGWRHVKRPGVDKFIEQLSNYYEIVIFCENDIGMMEHVLMAIDKDGRTHKLGPSAGEQHNGVILKRLDCLNRDLRRIILIDDNPVSAQKFLGNTILVKPYEDVRMKSDTTLLDLIPILQAIAQDEEIRDFRVTLDELGTHNAADIVSEYHYRITTSRVAELQKRNRGLGKFIRANAGLDTTKEFQSLISQPEIIPKLSEKPKNDKIEPKPVENKKKGSMFEWLENNEKERMDATMKKREIMENMYREKMMEKMKKNSEGGSN